MSKNDFHLKDCCNHSFCDHVENVSPDCVFFALPGKKHDLSYKHAMQAIEHKAGAIVAWESVCKRLMKETNSKNIRYIVSNNPRADYTQACKEASGYKSTCKIIAITGTKGKTSIAYMLNCLYNSASSDNNEQIKTSTSKNDIDQSNYHASAAYIGTLGTYINKQKITENTTSLTSPTPKNLYQELALLESMNVSNIVLEYTSIGIDGFRCVENLHIGVLTNFTGDDHLIYHTTVENYQACKMLMFEKVNNIVCWDQDPLATKLANRYPSKPFFTYSITNPNAFCYLMSVPNIHGFDTKIYIQQKLIFQGQINLLGNFQLLNLAGAIACWIIDKYTLDQSMQKHYSLEIIANESIKRLQKALLEENFNVPGRMEIMNISSLNTQKEPVLFKEAQANIITQREIASDEAAARSEAIAKNALENSNSIIIDYAHTPNSLEQALQALLMHGYQQIILIFGCGGNRDHAKRGLMGEIAAKYAKYTIITDDNPRFEDAASIRKMILETCPNGIEIADRRQAIEYGMKLLKQHHHTALLISGKGHEEYQIIGNEYVDYSDKNVVMGCGLVYFLIDR